MQPGRTLGHQPLIQALPLHELHGEAGDGIVKFQDLENVWMVEVCQNLELAPKAGALQLRQTA